MDIVLGTHRLLSEDIFFARLGLLIVDEEHRFGVMDKERIKKIRHGIDILSLSATPIPRSLNMAISGLRQLSVITTPPRAKKPIHTLVSEWKSEYVREALLRELDRGGQVIYIHNRVAALSGIARDLQELIGKRVHPCILHGQMSGEIIEETLMDFKSKKYNLLVATTVIENGVNFLTANTILIDSADEF